MKSLVLTVLFCGFITQAQGRIMEDPSDLQFIEQYAQQGNVKMQYVAGLIYYGGIEVPQDYARARKWFEKAALQGYKDAQLIIGQMYFNGTGVP
jgi:uncharacterized protein